jgi:hypothetical protein
MGKFDWAKGQHEMKLILGLTMIMAAGGASAQVWKTLPEGVRIFGYRNVTTSKIKSNFNQFRSESALGSNFRIDANTINGMAGNQIIVGQDISHSAYNALVVGEYQVDADANANVHGFGFGYGITNKVMFYAEVAYYKATVNAQIRRTRGNSFEDVARMLQTQDPSHYGLALGDIARRLTDVNERQIQSAVTNYYGYKPIGQWDGAGYGDLDTGFMMNIIDRGTWGLMFFPGITVPTGRQDDPDMLQDIGFGDGQWDVFSEIGTGYSFSDKLSVGAFLRYTYQAPTTKTLRVPTERDFVLSRQKGEFNVKYGDRINLILNTTYNLNDWIAFSPVYRYMYQGPAQYNSDFGQANDFLAFNSDKEEHAVQFTTTISSIQPFLKKQFVLPAQINVNVLQTVAGRNVAKVGRFEVELRMLF